LIAFIRNTSGLGNAAIYTRLRNATGQFWDFVGVVWSATLTANCKQFLTEYADADPTTAYYSKAVTIPTDDVYSVEVVLDSTSLVLGYEGTGYGVMSTRVGANLGFTGANVNVQVKAQDNIDFGALQKSSINAATPAVTVSDKTGFSLSAAGIQAVWDYLTSALTVVGSIGKKLADLVIGASPLDAAGVRAAVGLATANLDTQISALPKAGSVID